MEIQDWQIDEIEKELLSEGQYFDDERRQAIKSLETCDIIACPGSGKTTVLVAKLMILDRYFLPLPKGRGICVLAHTNVAIDEIREKLGRDSKLSRFPNFLGTIQGFVDKFVAIPYYASRYKKRPERIDNFAYESILKDFLSFCMAGERRETFIKVLHLKAVNPDALLFYRLGIDTDGNRIILKGLNDNIWDPRKPRSNTDWTSEEKLGVKNYLLKLKESILTKGVLHYDDAYFLADEYLFTRGTSLRNSLSNRFQFCFVDEMQDTDYHQLNVLNRVFNNETIIQKIGDLNQSIYNSVKTDQYWRPGSSQKPITGSQRFSKVIAKAIEKVCLNPVLPELTGVNRVIQQGSELEEIQPTIILFDDSKIDQVIPTFQALIERYKLHLPETTGLSSSKLRFKAIGWVGKDEDTATSSGEVKHFLKHYYPFKRKSKERTDYEYLEDYCELRPLSGTSLMGTSNGKFYRNVLLQIFLKVLQLGRVFNSTSYHNVHSFEAAYKTDKQAYASLQLLLFSLSMKWHKGVSVKTEITNFILTELKQKFQFTDNQDVQNFLNNTGDNSPSTPSNLSIEQNSKECESDGVKYKIEIATIHSVKGETHTGTCYLETFKNGYESTKKNRGILPFMKGGHAIPSSGTTYLIEALKMAYVGFSRPTHLLCVAIHKQNFPIAEIADGKYGVWEVTEV